MLKEVPFGMQVAKGHIIVPYTLHMINANAFNQASTKSQQWPPSLK